MRFVNVEVLLLLVLLLPLTTFFVLIFRKKRVLRERFAQNEMFARLSRGFSLRRQKVKAFLQVMAYAFLTLSLADPQWGAKIVEVRWQGVDVFLALDVSLSMLAKDFKPNRLTFAKEKLKSLADKLQGNRIGVIAFAGEAKVFCPLTVDTIAVKMYLDELGPATLPTSGTAIGEAIEHSLKNFPTGEKKSRVLVLLTDGEDHHSHPQEAAKKAKEQGVRIYAIGIGSPQGEPIPLQDSSGKVTGYKKDRSGNLVLSKLDEKTLREITSITGGGYFCASYGGVEMERILSDISSMEKKEMESQIHGRLESRFQYPLTIAFLLLAVELLISERRRAVDEG